MEVTPVTLQEAGVLGAGSYSTASEYGQWTAYAPHYGMAPSMQDLYQRPTTIVSSGDQWPSQHAIMSPVSATTAPPNQFWYPHDKTFPTPINTTLDLSYPLELQTMLPTVSESVSPYVPYATTEWDQASVQSITPIGVKAESSSPIAILDSQPLSATLNIHAKQSYIDAYWKYFHPLFPILHKPTMEQQPQNAQQQSGSSLLLRAALVMCGATFTREDSRWWDGKLLLRKCLQYMTQVSANSSPTGRKNHWNPTYTIPRSTLQHQTLRACKLSSSSKRTLNSTASGLRLSCRINFSA